MTSLLEPSESPKSIIKEWKVWADRACGVRGSRIGILLQSQSDIKLQYAAKLAFNATNNIAEYEAIIMALRIIKELGIQKFTVFNDSQLVVN